MVRTLNLAALAFLFAVLPATNAFPEDPAEAVEIVIDVSPKTIVLDSETTWVTVHTNLPYGSVANATLSLNGIPIRWTKSDARGYLVCKFSSDDVKGIVAPPSAVLTLEGESYFLGPFYGTDEVTVIAGKVK